MGLGSVKFQGPGRRAETLIGPIIGDSKTQSRSSCRGLYRIICSAELNDSMRLGLLDTFYQFFHGQGKADPGRSSGLRTPHKEILAAPEAQATFEEAQRY